ncbi:hypothetical protein J3R30DRAFT_3701532 [Lentinula aciculospora]|uniref:F-box domain-containing protein n=1 Tax=Lentinula aciculospora TaxID=153920 RepID=A0A9W9DPE1_9AGAR|nr:hypothetical protein J3R30DRAFT_3701532 [Lentinula aciculospora]
MDNICSSIEDLPYDLAGEIFSHLLCSADLLHVAQASKSLYSIAIRLLYRDIRYETVPQLFYNLPFWQRPHNLGEVPRSVVIGRVLGQSLCQGSYIQRAILHIPGDGSQSSEERFSAAFPQLRKLLLSFSKLQKLTFQQARLSPEIHNFLGELPDTIRSLSFERCSFFSKSVFLSRVPPTNFTMLPITELSLTGVHAGWVSPTISSPTTMSTNVLTLPADLTASPPDESPVVLDMYHILARSTGIKALCLDWNIACAGRFSRYPGLLKPVFRTLDHLEVRLGVRNYKTWNAETNSSENKVFLMNSFAKLLASCNHLTELVLFGYIPGLGDKETTRPILPALTSYTGPVDFLKSSLRRCDKLQKLIFPDTVKDIDAVMSEALPFNAKESVRHLEIAVEKWDIEVLYAISMELPSLEVLKIKYDSGFPEQDMLISFGPEFFSRISRLTIFHLHRPEIEYDELRYLGVYSNLSRFVDPAPKPRKHMKPKHKIPYASRAPRRDGWATTMTNIDTESDSHFMRPSYASVVAGTADSVANITPNASSISTHITSANNGTAIGSAGTSPVPIIGATNNATNSFGSITVANTGLNIIPPPYHFATFSPHNFVPQFLPGHRWRCTCRHRTRAMPKPSPPDLGPCGLPDAHEYMASWEKFAPGLREVRLVDAFVWRRAGVGDEWCRRDLKELPAKDEEEQESEDDGYCRCNPARFMDEEEEELFD